METFKNSLNEIYQKVLSEEIDIIELEISNLTTNLLDETFENRVSSLFFLTIFLLWKSRKLLPKEEIVKNEEEEFLDPISLFVEYSRFKEIAENLSELEKRQLPHVSREVTFVPSKETGLDELKLEDLVSLFEKMIQNYKPQKIIDLNEEFPVSSSLDWLKEYMVREVKVPFFTLFSFDKSKNELIALFLALLELIKLQELTIIKEDEILLCLKR